MNWERSVPDTTILTASTSLGPRVAAFTCRVNGQSTVVLNPAARGDPAMQMQAALVLLGLGVDAGTIYGAIDGIRS
jgi:hypothetical protein